MGYGASLCELDAIVVCSNSLPRTMPAWLLAYNKIKKENKNCKKIICYRVFQGYIMMATALSTQNEELTSKDLPVPKKSKSSNF